MSNTIRVLCFGDVVGQAGRVMFQKHIGRLRRELCADAVVVNGENSGKNGRGITSRIMHFFRHNGVDVVTSGNHIWAAREIYHYLNSNNDLLRPANFPSGCPGSGFTTFECKGQTVGIINIQGRVFMREHVDCPFRAIDSVLTYMRTKTKLIVVDFHAEATSEKASLGQYLDGRVSAVVGTHTHVQTADERILPQGTAFISDLGMAGAQDSSLGMKKDIIIQSMLTQMPVKFIVETNGPFVMSGVYIDIDVRSGKALAIERFKVFDDTLKIDVSEEDE